MSNPTIGMFVGDAEIERRRLSRLKEVTMSGKKETTDTDRLRVISGKLNQPSAYSSMVAGVHTWNVAEIFKDFREVLTIARRLNRTLNSKESSR